MDNFFFQGRDIYRRLLEDLDGKIYDNQENVLPYFPKAADFPNHPIFVGKTILFLDFLDTALFPVGTMLKIYVNNSLLGNVRVEVGGIISKAIEFGYGTSELSIKNFAGTNTYKTITFTTLNFPLYLEVMANCFDDIENDLKLYKGNVYADEVAGRGIYEIYGALFGFPIPQEFSLARYYNVLLGDGGNYPGFNNSFPYSSTLRALVDTSQSFSGIVPTVEKLGLGLGCGGFQVFDYAKWDEAGNDQDLGRTHYFVKG